MPQSSGGPFAPLLFDIVPPKLIFSDFFGDGFPHISSIAGSLKTGYLPPATKAFERVIGECHSQLNLPDAIHWAFFFLPDSISPNFLMKKNFLRWNF